MKISELRARQILDSRGIPTIETWLKLEDGTEAVASVPSGTSSGSFEVIELRDGDKKHYGGKGVLKAVEVIENVIAAAVKNREFNSQRELDYFLKELDGTEQKSKLGGNSILSVSMAFCRASAKSQNLELYEYFGQQYWGANYSKEKLSMPDPMILVMEGATHGNWATDVQEYMVMFEGPKFSNFESKLRAATEIFNEMHDLLVEKNYSATVGQEGAFAPIQLQTNFEAFEVILEGVKKAGYARGSEIRLAIDIASSEFYDKKDQLYKLKREKKELTADKWTDLQREWYEQLPMRSVEDPMSEDDWQNWALFTHEFGEQFQVVGDDLLTTNVSRIKKAIDEKACTAVLIKLNQIGSVTETLDAIKLSEHAGMTSIISHRAGEVNDDMIADLAVGTAATQCKFGGPNRGERVAKYNRLLKIEHDLGLA